MFWVPVQLLRELGSHCHNKTDFSVPVGDRSFYRQLAPGKFAVEHEAVGVISTSNSEAMVLSQKRVEFPLWELLMSDVYICSISLLTHTGLNVHNI